MPEDRHVARAWLDQQEDGDRKNARMIDKVMVALPVELTREQRAQLVETFAETISKGRASWFAAIHDSPAEVNEKGQFNPHAHIVFRDRDVETRRRVMELSEITGTDKLRLAWERSANLALERAGFDVRIDRRSLAAQGIERDAEIHVGPNALMIEAKGERRGSKPLEIVRHFHGTHRPIIIDYPALDAGRTRAEHNEEIRARNKRHVPVAGDELQWTDRAGMVAQQRAAMEWVGQSQARLAASAQPQPAKNTPEGTTKEQTDRAARLAAFLMQRSAEHEKQRQADLEPDMDL
jgi:hypothetical protein